MNRNSYLLRHGQFLLQLIGKKPVAKTLLTLPLILMLLAGCGDRKPFVRTPSADDWIQRADAKERPNGEDVMTFYVMGDWGTGNDEQHAVAQALREDVSEIPAGREIRPFVLELGDNVYEHGLPQGWDAPGARRLLQQTFGRVYSDVAYHDEQLIFHIVPGNHDYNGRAGGKKGYGDVLLQETLAEALFKPYWQYYPIDPKLNSDTDDLSNYQQLRKENILTLTVPQQIPTGNQQLVQIVAIDTQVLLDLYSKKDTSALKLHLQKLDELLQQPAVWKFVVGHHPLATHGTHGGFRTAIWWIPPITLFTLYDKLFYKRLQDIDHPAYRAFRRDLLQHMKKYGVTAYFSGHEHNLQLLKLADRQLQLISGSAGKRSPVTHGRDTYFSHASFGLTRLDVTAESLWIDFLSVDTEENSARSSALFRMHTQQP